MSDFRIVHDPYDVDSALVKDFRDERQCGLVEARNAIIAEYRDASITALQDALIKADIKEMRLILHDVLELMRKV